MRHVTAKWWRLVDIIRERERGGERERGRKEAKRQGVRAFAFLLALAVEEAGLALSNAEAVRGEKVK